MNRVQNAYENMKVAPHTKRLGWCQEGQDQNLPKKRIHFVVISK